MTQFVSFELDTADPSFQAWAQRFPSEGQTIPKVYIIRADGEALYAKSGPLTGAALPQLLSTLRAQAGLALTAKQAQKLTDAVSTAKSSLESGDVAKAVETMAPFAAVESYAEPAIEAKTLLTKMNEDAAAKAREAAGKLASETEALDGAIALAQASREYKKLPQAVKAINEAKKKPSKDAKIRELLLQGGLIDKARSLAKRKNLEKAVEAFELIVSRYPDTPAAELAKSEAAQLKAGGEAAVAKPTDGGPQSAEHQQASSKLRLAKAFARTNPEKARAYAEEAIKLAPDTDLSREAEALLAELK